MQKKSWQLPITIVLVFLGILLSAQLQTQTRVLSDLSMQKTEDLITMVRNLTEKRFQLEKELEDIEGKLIALKNSNSDELNIINNLRAELNKLEIINGTKEVKGPGLKVIISKDSPILYIDIVSIINELWAAGAEAISVNDTRIDYSTVFFYTETENSMFITLNHKPLTFPIIIKAIGNPNTLEKGLTLPGGIIDNLALFRAYPYLEQEEEIIIPPIENELVLLEAELVRK
ncbi:MAG: hypothetical protein PWQ67_2084 [Clostridia bacterium]|nr:hypothetical protein [Clostridia bacterium]MDN5323630.1 hypothetical protein [Clostridia bacterium]